MKLELNVPTSLNEITLGQYQKFLVTKDGSNDEEFIAQKMIEIFCGIQLKDKNIRRYSKVSTNVQNRHAGVRIYYKP